MKRYAGIYIDNWKEIIIKELRIAFNGRSIPIKYILSDSRPTREYRIALASYQTFKSRMSGLYSCNVVDAKYDKGYVIFKIKIASFVRSTMIRIEEDRFKGDSYKDFIYRYRKANIPEDEYREIMDQEECELTDDFLGFLDVYKSLSQIIPKNFTIVDLGCYLAAQSYLFKDFDKYIGVDRTSMKRFKPNNTTHYICSIQYYIETYAKDLNLDKTFAICSYVEDDDARNLVKSYFKNVYVYYPSLTTDLEVI